MTQYNAWFPSLYILDRQGRVQHILSNGINLSICEKNTCALPGREPHAELIRSYNNITEYITQWLPHIKQKMMEEGDDYLTDVYEHDIAARVVFPGLKFKCIYSM